MSAIVLNFADGAAAARRFAKALSLPCKQVAVHRFPDRECLIRIPASAETVLLYRSLNDPDAKLVELILGAAAARDGGASRVILVAPYLAYMRQDKAFHSGEAISQRVIGRLLAQHFDALLTVDPHLHRIATLTEAVPGLTAVAVSAAPLLSTLIDPTQQPLIVAPDGEATQWTRKIAKRLRLSVLTGAKKRRGDREVVIRMNDLVRVRHRTVIVVDDVIASGSTVDRAAAVLLDAGASQVDAVVTHCLAAPEDLARLAASGIRSISSTDSVDGLTARVEIAQLLADAVRAEDWLCGGN